MNEKYDLSLILACYNEGSIFEKNVEKVFEILDQTDFSYEIIFVDDKSTDGTKNKIDKILKKNLRRNLSVIFHDKNLGRGKTVSDGIVQANGGVVGFIDIDLEIPADYIPRFVMAILNGYDVATAFRIYDFTFRAIPRWIGSKGYNKLRGMLIGNKLKDTEAGYKFFNLRKILPVLKKTQDFGWFWDTEIMIRSLDAGLKIIEIPTVFIRNFEKKSTVNLIPDSINYFIKLIKFKNKLT